MIIRLLKYYLCLMLCVSVDEKITPIVLNFITLTIFIIEYKRDSKTIMVNTEASELLQL